MQTDTADAANSKQKRNIAETVTKSLNKQIINHK